MTVSELISILRRHDPAAVVVLPWDGDDDTLVLTFEELRPGSVQAVQMHKLPGSTSWYDPLAGAQLYEELLNDGAAGAVKGVLLG